MRKHLLYVILFSFLYCLTAHAVTVSRHMSGSWYNPDQNGHGISLEILNDNRAVFYWYIYNPDGAPTFLIAIGNVSGEGVFADAYYHSGMRWGVFDDEEVEQLPWGTLQLDFSDCNNLTLFYSSTHGRTDIPFGDGNIPMVRLANIDLTQCNDNRAAGIYRGYLDPGGGDDEALGATFLLSEQGHFVAWVDDVFAAFGSYGLGEAEHGEFWLEEQPGTRVYYFDQPGGEARYITGRGALSPEYRIIIDHWQTWPDPPGTGDMYAIDSLYRRGLDFNVFIGLAGAEELVSGETGFIDVWPDGGGWRLSGTIGDRGCTVGGTLLPFDPLFNMVQADLTVTNCDDRNGNYQGLGGQTDVMQFGDGRQLMIFTHDGNQPFALSLTAM